MAITPRLELKTTQSLQMTPQLQQAISLLQMSNLELQEMVNQELDNNPFLEREDDNINSTEISSQEINSAGEKASEEEIISQDYDNQFEEDYGSDREGYEGETDFGWEDYQQSKQHNSDEEFDYFEKKLKNTKSLYEHLQQQIELNFTTTKEKAIAFVVVKFSSICCCR